LHKIYISIVNSVNLVEHWDTGNPDYFKVISWVRSRSTLVTISTLVFKNFKHFEQKLDCHLRNYLKIGRLFLIPILDQISDIHNTYLQLDKLVRQQIIKTSLSKLH